MTTLSQTLIQDFEKNLLTLLVQGGGRVFLAPRLKKIELAFQCQISPLFQK